MNNSTHRIQAVTFDMDGLMFNTEDIYDVVGAKLLEERGHEFTRELKLKMMGLPGPQAFEAMKEHCGLGDDIESLELESQEIYLRELPRRIQLMPGLTTLLELLESRSIPKAVATSSHREHAEFAMNHFDLIKRFEFVLTSADVINGKPAPDIYVLAARRFDIPVQEMLVLEDSLIGSRASAASGALTVAIPGSHSIGQDYSHADYVVDRLDSEVILMLLNR